MGVMGVMILSYLKKKQRIDDFEKRWKEFDSQQGQSIDQLLQMQQPKGNSNRLECIPEFDPKKNVFTTKQWIATLEQFSAANTWNEANLIFHMQSQLQGMTRTWFDGSENYNRT